MSIISVQSEDKSDFLCKRFAELASSYFEHPEAAKIPSAHVPLENLFRVLEMFRNDTFHDENRKGVLALENAGTMLGGIRHEDSWYVNIKDALSKSMVAAFGQNVVERDAAGELQLALRWLVAPVELPDQDATVNRAKTFFTQLSTSL